MITSEELITAVENDATEINFKSVAENLLEAITPTGASVTLVHIVKTALPHSFIRRI